MTQSQVKCGRHTRTMRSCVHSMTSLCKKQQTLSQVYATYHAMFDNFFWGWGWCPGGL